MIASRKHAPQDVWERPFVKAHQQWCDDFVLELRLRDVPGAVIGDRLAEVEAHCAESGESPDAAFGEPVDYARTIVEDSAPERVTGVWRIAVLSVAQVVALLVGTSAAAAWGGGEALSYNAVQLAAIGVLGALLLSLPLLLGPLVNRPWSVGVPLFALGILAGIGSSAGGALDLPVLVSLHASAVAVGLFVVVLLIAVAELRELSVDDRVTSPLEPRLAEQPRARRPWLPVLLVPVAYVVLAGVSLLAA